MRTYPEEVGTDGFVGAIPRQHEIIPRISSDTTYNWRPEPFGRLVDLEMLREYWLEQCSRLATGEEREPLPVQS